MSWPIRTLSEVCDVVNGGTPKTGVKEYWNGPHQWVTPAEMGGRDTPFIAETERSLSDAGLSDSAARLVPANSVILSSRAPIGHLVINEVPMAFNQGCKGLVPRNGLDFKYLYYWLFSQVDMLNALGTGATFKEVSLGKLRSVPIPVPPLPQQRRITAILDEAFAGIAKATANAERNIENARELATTQGAHLFVDQATGSQARLGDVVTRLTNGYVGPTREIYVSDGVPYLLARHVHDGVLEFDGRTFVTQEFNDKHKKSKLKAGDVLLVQSGHIGHSAVVTAEHDGHNCHAMIVISPKQESLDGRYLAAYFQQALAAGHFERIRTGSTVPHLNCGHVKEMRIPLPPLDRQRVLADRWDGANEQSKALIAINEQRRTALSELRTSLLHRAFTGQLTDASAVAA